MIIHPGCGGEIHDDWNDGVDFEDQPLFQYNCLKCGAYFTEEEIKQLKKGSQT